MTTDVIYRQLQETWTDLRDELNEQYQTGELDCIPYLLPETALSFSANETLHNLLGRLGVDTVKRVASPWFSSHRHELEDQEELPFNGHQFQLDELLPGEARIYRFRKKKK